MVTFTAPTASDLVDGDVEVECDSDSGSTFPLGTTVVVCTGTDAAGNFATRSFTVSVSAASSGFLTPLEKAGTHRLGSTIPVKFSLTGASAGITDLQARIYVHRIGSGTGDGIAGTSTSAATSGNLFRYADGQVRPVRGPDELPVDEAPEPVDPGPARSQRRRHGGQAGHRCGGRRAGVATPPGGPGCPGGRGSP